MSNHLQHITAQAKRIRKANPSMPWTECISQASKQLGYGAGVGRKPKYKVYARAVTPGKRKAKAKKEQLLLPAPRPTMVAPKVRKPKKTKRIAPVVPKMVAPKVVKPKVVKPKVQRVKKVAPVKTAETYVPGNVVYPKVISPPKRKKEKGVYYDDSLYAYPQIPSADYNNNYTTKYFTNDHKLAKEELKKGLEVFAIAKNPRLQGAYYQLQTKDIVPLMSDRYLDGRHMFVDTDAPFYRYVISQRKKSFTKVAGTRSRKILSVDQFDKFARSKGFNPKFADTDRFVEFMFKYSKDLFGRASLKGMSWNTIYALNPMSADWISWSKIDTDSLESYIRQYSTGKRKVGALTRQQKLENKDIDAYNWFVVSQDGEIDSGWEYKSDAMDHAKEHNEYPYKGKRWSVISLRTLKQRGLEDPRNRWKHVGSMSKVKSKIKNIGNITLK